MTAILEMPKRVIDISKYWPKDKNGNEYTVNKVWTDRELNPEGVGRYTLQKAKEGILGGGDIDTIYSLMSICSLWSGQTISLDKLVRKIDG